MAAAEAELDKVVQEIEMDAELTARGLKRGSRSPSPPNFHATTLSPRTQPPPSQSPPSQTATSLDLAARCALVGVGR
jgi:hypothetical protein